MRGAEAECSRRHLAKRTEREGDMSSKAKDPEGGLVAITGPMPRAAKGYPRRKMVYELHEKVIDKL